MSRELESPLTLWSLRWYVSSKGNIPVVPDSCSTVGPGVDFMVYCPFKTNSPELYEVCEPPVMKPGFF